jgi:galactokinase/mevalonate kinase-like predicted kinase
VSGPCSCLVLILDSTASTSFQERDSETVACFAICLELTVDSSWKLESIFSRYLRRDARAISSVRRLTELATAGQKALATGNLDALGLVLSETWELHQELDPHCSNPEVER